MPDRLDTPADTVSPAPLSPAGLRELYDEHPEYLARRQAGSFEQAQVDLEVRSFKLPALLSLLDGMARPRHIFEIGCATGELIGAFPVPPDGTRTGTDISVENLRAARERFPEVEFLLEDFRSPAFARRFDGVILSDVIEHVPDDVDFLRDAARIGDHVLVNLPLEDNWLNRGRAYGPDDVSGHLRRYSLTQGLALFDAAGLEVLRYHQVWIHETAAEQARRDLRRRHFGQAYTGGPLSRAIRATLFATARRVRPIGRQLFSSNLFALARRRSTP